MHSGFVISKADARPMYLQIMEQVRQKVAVGDWVPGQDIPSIRQLAVDLEVSVITVKRAYLELEREGIIITQHGKGSSIAPDAGGNTQPVQEDLDRHLAEAARLGAALGLRQAELAARLREAADRMKRDER